MGVIFNNGMDISTGGLKIFPPISPPPKNFFDGRWNCWKPLNFHRNEKNEISIFKFAERGKEKRNGKKNYTN
jgi:hypothetical protein